MRRTMVLGLLMALVAAAGVIPAGAVAPTASPQASPAAGIQLTIAHSDTAGDYLATPEGMTLYVFVLDKPNTGISACQDDCATKWPPFLVTGQVQLPDGIEGELGTMNRTDGATQLTWNGMPLYTFTGDVEPGQTNAQGTGAGWTQCNCHEGALPTVDPASYSSWLVATVTLPVASPTAES